jgi:predicted MFS family arabinose efflux permease
VGGFITESHLGWRWTAYITLIMAAIFGTIGFISIPETYAPKLLRQKATRLRHQSKNWAFHAKVEESTVDLQGIATKYLLRPYRKSWNLSI